MNKLPLLAIIPLLLSCSTIPTATDDTIDQAFESKNKSKQEMPQPETTDHNPPTAVTDALIPDFNQNLYNTGNTVQTTRFNLSLHEVDAREFFMGLVIDTDENMMVHPDVSGKISLNLKNVTVAQVLQAVNNIYGYDYKKNDIGYIVYPSTIQTKIFKINRLDLVREGRSNTRVSSGQISESADEESSDSDYLSSESKTKSSGSWINTTSSTDFWDEINTALQSIISIDPQATIVINRQTGVLVVRAKPMQLREVQQFIDATQKQLGRQVIIEAKIIEIILDDEHQAGVNWQSIAREAIKTAPILTGIGAMGTTFREVFTVGGTFGDFAAYVELMETQGKTNILSSPRIATLSNQKAIIKVGSDEYFITDISSNTVSSGSSTITNPDITWTPFFSGIALDVTPQINDQDEITLHIHPSITRVESQTKEFTINGEDGSVPLAINTVRESDSIIKAKDGQIVVIGGLMQEFKTENKKGIAGLAQLPYVGNLFRVNAGETKKSELVILLKTTLINNNGDWAPSMDTSKKQLKQLLNHQLWE